MHCDPWSINFKGRSEVSIQLSTEECYRDYPERFAAADVHGILLRVASLEDTLKGKMKAWADPVESGGGYRVSASLDRPATIELRDDHALITLAHHRLRVEEGRVVLDDNETAAFLSMDTGRRHPRPNRVHWPDPLKPLRVRG